MIWKTGLYRLDSNHKQTSQCGERNRTHRKMRGINDAAGMKAGRGWELGHRERLTLQGREDTPLFEAEEKEEGNCDHIRCFDKQQKEVERMAPGQLGPALEGKDLQGRAC